MAAFPGLLEEMMNKQESIFNKRELLLALLCLVPVLYFFLSYYFSPYHYAMLVVEDGFGEWLIVAFYFSAAFLAIRHALRQRKDKKPFFFVLCFGLGAFVLGMEEISWGMRIIGYDIESISRHSDQEEVNLHNIVGNRNIRVVAGWVVLLYGVLAPLVLGLSGKLWSLNSRLNIPFPPIGAIPIFLTSAALYVFKDHFGRTMVIEISELLIAIGLLVTAVGLQAGQVASEPTRNRRAASVSVWCVLAALLVTEFTGYNDDVLIYEQLMEFAEFSYPEQGMDSQRIYALGTAARWVSDGHAFPYGISKGGIYLSRAYAYEDMGNEGRRVYSLKRANKLCKLEMIEAMHNMGVLYLEQGDKDKAGLVFKQAEEWTETFTRDHYEFYELFYLLRKVYASQGKKDEEKKLKGESPKIGAEKKTYLKSLRKRYRDAR
jgi:hypothetical protein